MDLIRPQTGYRLGLQMMIGLPGDNAQGALATARRMAGWSPDFVRIYPTLVLKGSLQEQWQARGRYTPLRLEEAVAQAKHLYLLFLRQGISDYRPSRSDRMCTCSRIPSSCTAMPALSPPDEYKSAG